MSKFQIGQKLPEEFVENISEGMSGVFSEEVIFILKMEDLTKLDVEAFNEGKIAIDLLELDMYKEQIGNIYAFSVCVEEFIDNSEVMIDFVVDNIEEIMPKNFEQGKGINSKFVLVNEEDVVLAVKEFTMGTELSNVVAAKSYEQNSNEIKTNEDGTDYIMLAFQKIFENEPEENLKLYSLASSVVE